MCALCAVVLPVVAKGEGAGLCEGALDDDEVAESKGCGVVVGAFGAKFDGVAGVVVLVVGAGEVAVLCLHDLAQGGQVACGFVAAVGSSADATQ